MGSLSKINSIPTYTTKLISNIKEQVTYRPYTSGEQKKLLVAKLEDDQEQIYHTLDQLIKDCTNGKVSIYTHPSFDIEYLMILMRMKAAGEIVNAGLKCGGCQKDFPITIDLNKITVTDNRVDNRVKIGEGLYVVMKYPTIISASKFSVDNVNSVFEEVARCIECIVNGDEVFDCTGKPVEEVVEFLDSLFDSQLEKIKEFFDRSPTITYKNVYECPHCQHMNEVEMRGASYFFQ